MTPAEKDLYTIMAVRKMFHDFVVKMNIDPLTVFSIIDGMRVKYFVESGLMPEEFKVTQKIISEMYEEYLKEWKGHGMD